MRGLKGENKIRPYSRFEGLQASLVSFVRSGFHLFPALCNSLAAARVSAAAACACDLRKQSPRVSPCRLFVIIGSLDGLGASPGRAHCRLVAHQERPRPTLSASHQETVHHEGGLTYEPKHHLSSSASGQQGGRGGRGGGKGRRRRR